MIPQVLLQLIDKYNEKGKWFVFDDCIKWFNGKRWEYWCQGKLKATDSIFSYKGHLFIRNDEVIHQYDSKLASWTLRKEFYSNSTQTPKWFFQINQFYYILNLENYTILKLINNSWQRNPIATEIIPGTKLSKTTTLYHFAKKYKQLFKYNQLDYVEETLVILQIGNLNYQIDLQTGNFNSISNYFSEGTFEFIEGKPLILCN